LNRAYKTSRKHFTREFIRCY